MRPHRNGLPAAALFAFGSHDHRPEPAKPVVDVRQIMLDEIEHQCNCDTGWVMCSACRLRPLVDNLPALIHEAEEHLCACEQYRQCRPCRVSTEARRYVKGAAR